MFYEKYKKNLYLLRKDDFYKFFLLEMKKIYIFLVASEIFGVFFAIFAGVYTIPILIIIMLFIAISYGIKVESEYVLKSMEFHPAYRSKLLLENPSEANINNLDLISFQDFYLDYIKKNVLRGIYFFILLSLGVWFSLYNVIYNVSEKYDLPKEIIKEINVDELKKGQNDFFIKKLTKELNKKDVKIENFQIDITLENGFTTIRITRIKYNSFLEQWISKIKEGSFERVIKKA